VFVDRQLAGPYGRQDGLYVRPPFQNGIKQQGPQSEAGPAQQYRQALAALDNYCKSKYAGKVFADLTDDDKDATLEGLESGAVKLDGTDGQAFFEQAVKDVQMGFFADPLYRRQPRHGGVENDRLSGRALQLSRLGRPSTTSAFRFPPVSMAGRANGRRKPAEAR